MREVVQLTLVVLILMLITLTIGDMLRSGATSSVVVRWGKLALLGGAWVALMVQTHPSLLPAADRMLGYDPRLTEFEKLAKAHSHFDRLEGEAFAAFEIEAKLKAENETHPADVPAKAREPYWEGDTEHPLHPIKKLRADAAAVETPGLGRYLRPSVFVPDVALFASAAWVVVVAALWLRAACRFAFGADARPQRLFLAFVLSVGAILLLLQVLDVRYARKLRSIHGKGGGVGEKLDAMIAGSHMRHTKAEIAAMQGKIEAEVEDERHAVVGFARLCRMVVCGEFVFFLAHLFWPSSLGEGGYTALEALAVAV